MTMSSPALASQVPFVAPQQSSLTSPSAHDGKLNAHQNLGVNSHGTPHGTNPWYSYRMPNQQEVFLASIVQTMQCLKQTMNCLEYRIEGQETRHDELDSRLGEFGTEISNAVEHESLRADAHASHLFQLQNEVDTMDKDDRRLRTLLEGRFQTINQTEQDYRKMTDAKIEDLAKKLKESEERNKKLEEIEARINRLAACGMPIDPVPKGQVWVEVERMTLEEQD
ncbi:hypothetical protein BDV96DRAFT_564842 [Lophiotrema nucula]|uniref:Uncharacterized protein n=1 Tax=Lophiotrema nucula TaxID=690887 RepID=A0A6A5ZN73_9PLEO|nr:hypothetical protein BDV96DRAFT_564842 [Lophiotrema nucula]